MFTSYVIYYFVLTGHCMLLQPLDASSQKELNAALQGFLQQGQSLHLTLKVTMTTTPL